MSGGGRGSELFKSPCAQLYLVGDAAGESLLMQSGRFAVVLVRNPVSPLGAVVAMVDEVQWPLGLDSSVVKKEEGSFTFMLPGYLVYDLVLKELPSADLQKLEHILREYSDYGEPAESKTHGNAPAPPRTAEGRPSGRSSCEQKGGDVMSSQMKRRMLRAHRMSAVVKVFSRTLARGAISAANHVEPKEAAMSPHRPIAPDLNLAGVDAVVKVVEAVETGGRALLEGIGSPDDAAASSTERPGQPEHSPALSSASRANPMWTLNKPGLLMLYRVISVSLAMHSSSSSSGSGSGRSGSSSSSQIRRLFSSPSLSSSSSSGRSLSASPSCSGQGDHATTALWLQPPPMPAPPQFLRSPPPFPPPPPPPFSPPPPPLFSESSYRLHHSAMPPPPRIATRIPSSDVSSSSPFRIYRPRPPAPPPPSMAPPPPPSFIPRPPRFHPPPRS